LRGVGVAVLGDQGGAFSSSVLGVGFRVGGAVGEDLVTVIEGSAAAAYRAYAHRFTVIIPAALTTEQMDVVNHIIESQRPAHTLFDVCAVSAGLRAGQGLLLGITSVIGGGGGFSTLKIGGSALGRSAVIGRPELGAHLGISALGLNSTVG
jgi:hypothetical protein